MNTDDLEYSWSDGTYWSKYNHCRVWENGTYTIKARDKYGQITTTYYEVTNSHKAIVLPPTVKGMNVQEGEWIATNPSIKFEDPSGTHKYYIDIKFSLNGNWDLATVKGNRTVEVDKVTGNKEIYGRCRDDYGNISLPVTFTCGVDTSAPTNLNFVPTVIGTNRLSVTVSAIEDFALPLKYSITYDGGQNWSTPQIGRYFGFLSDTPGITYTINCRVYNAAGLYVEGTPVQVTIN